MGGFRGLEFESDRALVMGNHTIQSISKIISISNSHFISEDTTNKSLPDPFTVYLGGGGMWEVVLDLVICCCFWGVG